MKIHFRRPLASSFPQIAFVLCVFAVLGALWLGLALPATKLIGTLLLGEERSLIMRSQVHSGLEVILFSASGMLIYGLGGCACWALLSQVKLSEDQVVWKKWCWIFLLSASKIPAFLVFQYWAPRAGYSDANIFVIGMRLLIVFISFWTYLPFYLADLATKGAGAWNRMLKIAPLLVITDVAGVIVILTYGGVAGAPANFDWVDLNREAVLAVFGAVVVLLGYLAMLYVIKTLSTHRYSSIRWGTPTLLKLTPFLILATVGVPFLLIFYIFF